MTRAAVPRRGEVGIEVEGQRRVLAVPFGSLEEIEAEAGPLQALMQRLQGQAWTVSDVRAVIRAAITWEQDVDDLLASVGLVQARAYAFLALSAGMGIEIDPDEPTPKPKARATASRSRRAKS